MNQLDVIMVVCINVQAHAKASAQEAVLETVKDIVLEHAVVLVQISVEVVAATVVVVIVLEAALGDVQIAVWGIAVAIAEVLVKVVARVAVQAAALQDVRDVLVDAVILVNMVANGVLHNSQSK